MKNKLIFCELLVQYKKLFTAKQIKYMKDYFFNDLSFSEIAKKNKISSMAVCDNLKRCKKRLTFYENKLSLHKNYLKRAQLYEKISDKTLQKKLVDIELLKNEIR